MSNRNSISIAIAVAIFIIAGVIVGIISVSNNIQYDTCKRTTELYLAGLIKQTGIVGPESIASEWLKVDEDAEDLLFELVKKIDNSECRDYPYLPQGKDASGTDLDLYVRSTDRIEVKIGE